MILRLIEEKSAESIAQYVSIRAGIVLVCWLLMVCAVLIDFWSGVSTAKATGEIVESKGFRHSISKVADYMRVMLFALLFDILGICFCHFYTLPYMSLLGIMAVLCIEGKSVVENSHRKKSHAAKIPEIAKKIIKAVTAKQATELLEQLSSLTQKENKDENTD